MRSFSKQIPALGSLLQFIDRVRRKLHVRSVDPERRIRRIVGGAKNIFVLQIGSNDGMSGDPVFSLLNQQSSWHALLVEPVPYLFDRLRNNYEHNSRLQFANVAIAETVGTHSFYYVDSTAKSHVPDLPPWFDQLGSFNRSHITNHLGERIEPFIKAQDIQTTTLPMLLERYGVKKIDVLHIDAEGYDWRILKQLDLSKFRPAVILFEYKHLSDVDRAAAENFLRPNYRMTDLDVTGDYFCERL